MTMDIFAKRGDKVIFAHPENGNTPDKTTAKEHLEVDVTYTIERTDVDNWHTDVYLQEVPEVAFNSVMFEDEDAITETCPECGSKFIPRSKNATVNC